MARIVDGEVKEILTTSIEDTTPFINSAHVLVEKILGAEGLTEEHLTQIELWLAAHFACMMDPRETEQEADRARAKFEGKSGLGLDNSRYGQQVKLLDTTGLLAALDDASRNIRRQGTVVVAPRKEQTC